MALRAELRPLTHIAHRDGWMGQCAGPPAISADGTGAATFGDQVQSKDPTGPADGGNRLKTLVFERITGTSRSWRAQSAVSCHPCGRLFAAASPTYARQGWPGLGPGRGTGYAMKYSAWLSEVGRVSSQLLSRSQRRWERKPLSRSKTAAVRRPSTDVDDMLMGVRAALRKIAASWAETVARPK
jgi:hypothetical protein